MRGDDTWLLGSMPKGNHDNHQSYERAQDMSVRIGQEACFCLIYDWTHAGEKPEFVCKQLLSTDVGLVLVVFGACTIETWSWILMMLRLLDLGFDWRRFQYAVGEEAFKLPRLNPRIQLSQVGHSPWLPLVLYSKKCLKVRFCKGWKGLVTPLQTTHSVFQTLQFHMLSQRNTQGLRGIRSLYIKAEQLEK